MPFFMLFKVKKDLDYHRFKNELGKYGKLAKATLRPDKNDENYKFATADFRSIDDKNGLIRYIESIANSHNEKASYNESGNAGPHSSNTNHRPTRPHRLRNSVGNAGRYYYMDSRYGKAIEQKFLFDETIEKLEAFLDIPDTSAFTLKTTYPGLLIGAGYNHPKLKEDTEDFQIGFFFDHTTGLPVIPGSSIKGALRSVLPFSDDDRAEKKRLYCKEVYRLSDDKIDRMTDLFDDNETVFFDAYPIATDDERKKIFAEDYITSHYSDEPDGFFKDPNPVRFLKVRPGVTYRFQFYAESDTVHLFKRIILDRGLGAKTNVGYGYFEETD